MRELIFRNRVNSKACRRDVLVLIAMIGGGSALR
jgi:hypothetical protein